MLINTQKDSAQTVLVLHYTGGGMKEYRSRYKGEQKRALCTIMRSALTWTFTIAGASGIKRKGIKISLPLKRQGVFFSSYSLLSVLSVCLSRSLPLLTHLSWRKLVLAASSARSPAHAGICELVVGSRFKEHEWMNAIPPVSTALEVFSREDGDQQWELARQ